MDHTNDALNCCIQQYRGLVAALFVGSAAVNVCCELGLTWSGVRGIMIQIIHKPCGAIHTRHGQPTDLQQQQQHTVCMIHIYNSSTAVVYREWTRNMHACCYYCCCCCEDDLQRQQRESCCTGDRGRCEENTSAEIYTVHDVGTEKHGDVVS